MTSKELPASVGYFNKEMQAILEKGESKTTSKKQSSKKSSSKKK